MSKVIYLDLENGISGDMMLGALLDLGANQEVLENVIQDLGLDVGLDIEDKEQDLAKGKDVNITTNEEHKHRKIREVIGMIKDSSLDKDIKVKSINAFTELGRVEGKIHGQPVKDVELHETGMLDSIIDIIGSIALFEDLDIDEAYCSTVHLGSGTVECEHGTLSVPVPATKKLLEGMRVKMTEKEGELVTPTGAVLLKTLASQEPSPDMTLESVGIGFGDREKEYPNVLRVYSGSKTNREEVNKIEFYLDDITPEVLSYALERLRSHSLDVYQNPMIGKKSRSGWMITVLCEKDKISDIKDIIFTETSTLGIRITEEWRICKKRDIKKVETEYGEIKVKVSGDTVSPEFEECKKIALQEGIPLKDVYETAIESYKNDS